MNAIDAWIAGTGIAPAWWWLIVAALLAGAEIVAPGFFLIWLGGAAAITGIATLLLGLPDAAQFIVFALSAVALVLTARKWFRYTDMPSADPLLNERTARLVGQVVVVVDPIDETGGRVRVGDGVWSARGVHAAVGERVRVSGADGNVLTVENCS
ncbi:MAG TPA: NfeD family protein [Sphingomonas sp.]|jgi:membrane protein implicated in regulation of membrane protease activity|nr:NfeD family protein [Sphingomonas sp.]